uniref:Uncharacterized protein n=1 Tax=Arundo donax TaxID=35708 RepID=A0A0A8ZMP4_ARUDO
MPLRQAPPRECQDRGGHRREGEE